MDVFETDAERYDQWFDRHPAAYASEVTAIRAALPVSIGNGLEIGVGSGRFATPFGIVDGVEPAAAMRQIAKRRGIDAVEGVAEALPFEDETFDFALMVTTICFVSDPARSCCEAWRVLKPGGCFVVGFVDRDSFLGKHYEASREDSLFYRDARFFSAPEVENLLAETGFGDLQFRQTLFHHPNEIHVAEPVMSGYGQGGFAVVAGEKKTATSKKRTP